jgi:uncharacterized protein (TIGR02145 family)
MKTNRFLVAAIFVALALTFFGCSPDSGGDGGGYKGEYGLLYDSRDGKTYKTVVIGAQSWMAENLNYNMSGSWCYGDDPSNCAIYGRLYDMSAAQTACPSGWHLPSYTDWNILMNTIGGRNTANKRLMATNGWRDSNGLDTYGFSALPGGIRNKDGSFLFLNTSGWWWGGTTDFWIIDGIEESISSYSSFLFKDLSGVSVRCVKD